jgi:hypothetical protein
MQMRTFPFQKLHTQYAGHGGIIACTFDPDFPAQANRIDAAVRAMASLVGILVRVNRPP